MVSRWRSWAGWILLMIQGVRIIAGAMEQIAFPDAPEGVVWAVQFSDIHISPFHPNRALDLESLASSALKLVQPALVLITGDLTDAKNRALTVTRQDEAEWIQYRNSMMIVSEKSGLPLDVFFDLRGNHDKFGVPDEGSHLDFFSRYSISAEMNRREHVQAVVATVPGGWKYLFLGFDDTMKHGLRGPTNLFGHPTDSMLSTMDSMLERFGKDWRLRSAKIAFGHFPMSFTASSESGRRPEQILARHGVSAYLCGHLHTKFGEQLYRLHSYRADSTLKTNEFWEWEMGDWRGGRAMRVVSLDHGHASFLDVLLDTFENLSAIVFPTYPLDSRFMKKNPAYAGFDEDYGDSIRALVFSKAPVANVSAAIFDGRTIPPRLVDLLPMSPVPGPPPRAPALYESPWRRNRYSDPSALRYWLEIRVVDTSGTQTVSKPRPFSVDGSIARLNWGLSEFLVMGVQWADAYPVLLWLNIALVLGLVLLLPRLAYEVLKRNHSYTGFVHSVLARDRGDLFKLVIKFPAWVLIEGSRNAALWSTQVALVVWLLFFPWFWGLPFGPGQATGYLTHRGWRVPGVSEADLGAPDHLVVVLPYLYMALLPLTLVIACMSAERAACELSQNDRRKEAPKKPLGEKPDSGLLQLLESEVDSRNQRSFCSGCGRWIRKALYLACFIIGWFHCRHCFWLSAAFGSRVLVSPFTWSIPLLMLFAARETSGIRSRRQQRKSASLYSHKMFKVLLKIFSKRQPPIAIQ